MIRENKVKRILSQGSVALGTMVFEFNTTGIARIAAAAGADFVLFDTEHTGWSVDTVRMLMATSRGRGMRGPGSRPPEGMDATSDQEAGRPLRWRGRR